MKAPIELNIREDRTFLNFWNWKNGDDVVCEVKNGKLFLLKDENEPPTEITLMEFCGMVKTRIES